MTEAINSSTVVRIRDAPHGWVGPGEGGLVLLAGNTDPPDGVGDTAAIQTRIEGARADRLDRVVAFAPAGPPALVSRCDQFGFRRLRWRDRSAANGADLAAYVLDLSPVVIRPARPAELERAGALTVAGYVADGVVDPTDWYAGHLADAADRAAAATLLVAADASGAILGTVTFCRPGSPYAEISRPGEAEFRMLAVDPAARGAGIGAALVHACLDLAGAAGDRRLVLSTTAHMYAAARIYRRLGFVADPARNWSPTPGVDLLAYQRDVLPESDA